MPTDAAINAVLNPSNLQMYVQAGAVVICLFSMLILVYSMWTNYKMASNHGAHMQDALDRNTQAWVENAKNTERLAAKLDENTGVIRHIADKLE